jgi:hypothetical protein
LKDHGLQIVAVAQDSGGEAAAGPCYDAAGATFTTLIDVAHTVTALYGMVNVPTGVWIDEAGRMVRRPEVAWSRQMTFGSMTVGDDRYVTALRDWVEHGEASPYVLVTEERERRFAPASEQRRRADGEFQEAVRLHALGDAEGAAAHWKTAQELAPDNWNYHRQAWVFESAEVRKRKWAEKFAALGDRPYYLPLDLPS